MGMAELPLLSTPPTSPVGGWVFLWQNFPKKGEKPVFSRKMPLTFFGFTAKIVSIFMGQIAPDRRCFYRHRTFFVPTSAKQEENYL